MPTLGEASSRCLTTVKLGETSPGREHLDGDLVSRLDLLWDSSLQGDGEKPWLWWPASRGILLASC